MDNETEREAISEALARLFAGAPIRSSGNLDILTLAEEAGLKRNKLTHKHTDLRDAFYAERARREGVSEREIKLREQITELNHRLEERVSGEMVVGGHRQSLPGISQQSV